jgi:hypothetical protein
MEVIPLRDSTDNDHLCGFNLTKFLLLKINKYWLYR